MALHAIAVPILPGKLDAWKQWAQELAGPRRAEFEASRRELGVRERFYLQETPQGALALVTWEGADPQKTLAQLGRLTGPFHDWFRAKVKEIHGLDLASVTESPSKQWMDSGAGRPSAPVEQRV